MPAVARPGGRWAPLGGDILALLALMFAAGAVAGPGRGLLPVYLERDLAWAPPLIAAVTAARLLLAAISAPAGGVLADRLGPRRALVLGLLSLPVAGAVFLTPSAAVLVGLVLVAGLAEGLQATGSQTYLVARATAATIGLASGAFYVGSTLGGALGNLAAGLLLSGWGFGGLGLASLGAGLTVALAAAGLPGGRAAAARAPLGLAAALTGYHGLLANAPVRYLALLRFLSTCAWGVSSLLWPLLIARLSGDPAVAALFGTVSLLFAATAQLVTGRLVDRVGPSRPALVLTALVPLMAALSALAIGWLPALFAAGVAATCVAWSLSGTQPPLMRAVAPPGQAGQVVGLNHLLWCLAMLTGTLLAGWLVTVDEALPFWLAAALNLPTVLAARAVHRSLAGKT